MLKDPTRFDHEFFGIIREEADSMDAQIRILHEVTYESLWDAGKWLVSGFTVSIDCHHFQE